LSFGPIAAKALPQIAAAAVDAVMDRKYRRDSPDMLALPHLVLCSMMMRLGAAFCKQPPKWAAFRSAIETRGVFVASSSKSN
jgi:hypothetical protein